jgi:uroporphyrinogen decarboxylase
LKADAADKPVKGGSALERTIGCLRKLARMNAALHHREGDRVPVSDFFWGAFLQRWRRELDLPAEADIYRHYDLDWVVTTPNMDPHIKGFEILEENDEEVVVRTGYEAVIRKKFAEPMPEYRQFATDTLEKMERFSFDDPSDERRFFKGGDNQIAGVGDTFTRNCPPWIDSVKERHPDFPVYGSVVEGHEQLWRIIGPENTMLWIGLYPKELGRFIERLGSFLIDLTRAQIKAAVGLLDGMVIWGDVAYVNGMLFSPVFWRAHFKPIVAEQIRICHDAGLPVIYHGCGNASEIFLDLIELGLDCYNPLEAKSGLDVVDLRRRYGHRLAFCGNMDVLTWAGAPREELRRCVLRKLNAAKGGGYIFQSDHSVPGNISAERYQYVLELVHEKGTFPLSLGELDIPGLGE